MANVKVVSASAQVPAEPRWATSVRMQLRTLQEHSQSFHDQAIHVVATLEDMRVGGNELAKQLENAVYWWGRFISNVVAIELSHRIRNKNKNEEYEFEEEEE